MIECWSATNKTLTEEFSPASCISSDFTASHLYLAFSCYDDNPEGIVYRVSTRDSWRLQSDKISFDIDPYHDHRHAYHFAVGVANNQTDSYGMDINWDGVWDSATAITEEGWFAEISIPFSIIRFEAHESHTFGINFHRDIQRTRESLAWRGWRRNDGYMDLPATSHST